MGHIRDFYPELEKRGARAVTILAQNPTRIQEFLKDHSYPFPILADAERKVVKEYGVYVRANFESVNIARPANFILSADGTVRVHPHRQHPDGVSAGRGPLRGLRRHGVTLAGAAGTILVYCR